MGNTWLDACLLRHSNRRYRGLVKGSIFSTGGIGLAQRVKGMLHRIKTRQQRLEILRGRSLRAQEFDFRFNPVSHFPQPQGTGQARAAFKRVQGAQDFHACAAVVGPRRPLAQGGTQLGHQFRSLFLKNREQFRVDGIHRIDLVIFIPRKCFGSRAK